MTGLVIVADDLTGAADSAALLTRRGPTWVVLDPAADWPADAAVLAVDTDSRHRDVGTAAARAAAVTERAERARLQVVKKIDSTLRGHVAAEVRAVLDALSRRRGRVLAVVAPAFPAAGRTTQGGIVHVSGERLAAHDTDGDVVGLLGSGGLRTRWLPAADASTLAAQLEEAHAASLDGVVVDAVTDGDLGEVVAGCRAAAVPTLLVGSGGLTRPLAEDASVAVRLDCPPAAGAMLMVVGSYAAASRRQRASLLDHGVTPVLLDDASAPSLGAALRRGPVVLFPDPNSAVRRSDAPQVAERLAAATVSVLDEVGTLVLTGGETARAVLTAAAVYRFLVTGEVEPGIVRGHVAELGLDLVTKAGGFGDPNALLRCLSSAQVTANRSYHPSQEGSPA